MIGSAVSPRRRFLVFVAALSMVFAALATAGAQAEEGSAEGEVAFWLTVLHNNDGESDLLNLGSGLEDFGGVDRFSTVVKNNKRLARQQPLTFNMMGRPVPRGSVMVSSGDNFLAGPEFNASLVKGVPFFDAIAMDLIGYDAVAIGNHDFDFGPDVLEQFILSYTDPPPYLSANLDFSLEPGLQALVDAGIIAGSTIIEERGQLIGIVGATTPNLTFISSPRDVIVMDDVAALVQAEVDALEAAGVNKIIMISHLQDVEGDIELAALLDGVDLMVAGGGDELLANPDDLLVPGDEEDVFGPYPLIATDMDGTELPVVTTSGQYGYLGKLVVGFDAAGNLVMIDEDLSGPIRVAGGDNPDAVRPDGRVKRLVTDPVEAAVAELLANVIAQSEVDLNGLRSDVRSRETNEGNLIADSLLWTANQLAAEFGAPEADVALQNGGGIRNDSIIPAGPITEFDTFSMVPFPNFVTIVPDIPRSQFKEILENAVSRTQDGDIPGGTGRFAQIAGFSFEWDGAGVAQELDEDGNVVVPGSRIINVTLDSGDVIVEDGVVVAGDDIVVATINFLAGGGDEYPFRGAPFTSVGATYQQALSGYLTDALGGVITAADYPLGGEGRIVDLTDTGGEN